MGNYYVIDADAHVHERKVDWESIIEPAFKAKAPRVVTNEDGERRFAIDGAFYPNPEEEGGGRKDALGNVRSARPDGMTNPHERIPDMDFEGRQVDVLYGSTVAFALNAVKDVELAGAIARAWNNWLASYCEPYPERLKFSALVPMRDVPEAVREAKRAVTELGAVGVFFATHIGVKNVDSRDFDPVYEVAQELDVPVCVHTGTGSSTREGGALYGSPSARRFSSFYFTHALGMPFEIQIAATAAVCGGVFERHKRLRMLFLEGGVGWLPFLMERLDGHFEKLSYLVPWLSKPPSEYFKSDQFYISCDPDEEGLAPALATIGDDRIVYASDYAHWDSNFPETLKAIAERDELTEEQKHKVLGENAARLYKLPVPARVS